LKFRRHASEVGAISDLAKKSVAPGEGGFDHEVKRRVRENRLLGHLTLCASAVLAEAGKGIGGI